MPSKRTKLLIFSYHQFGLLIDTLKYCEYAHSEFDITYLGWDYDKPRVQIPKVTVKYVSREGNIIKRNIRLLRSLHRELKSGQYDVIFLHYIRGISLIRLLHLKKKMIFDVRTLSVRPKKIKRKTYDFLVRLESVFFKNVSVISVGVAQRLRLNKYSLLPLGADIVNIQGKLFNENNLNLLYVGTLDGRQIIKCVKGVEKYIKQTNDKEIRFTIVGDGPELEEIKKYIEQSSYVNGKITCTGRVSHYQLKTYFEWANIGVSFVPITPWYDRQPPTKTFEYLLAGLPVIATKIHENEKLLKDELLSELINDDIDSFMNAIIGIKAKLINGIERSYFQAKYNRYTWKQIVNDSFIPLVNNAR